MHELGKGLEAVGDDALRWELDGIDRVECRRDLLDLLAVDVEDTKEQRGYAHLSNRERDVSLSVCQSSRDSHAPDRRQS